MKKILAALAITIATIVPAKANDSDKCEIIAESAESVMQVRQAGVPIEVAIAIIQKNLTGLELIIGLAIVTDVYAIKIYETEDERATIAFATRAIYLDKCITADW